MILHFAELAARFPRPKSDKARWDSEQVIRDSDVIRQLKKQRRAVHAAMEIGADYLMGLQSAPRRQPRVCA